MLLKQLCYYRTIWSFFKEESFHLHLQCKHPNYPSLLHEAGIVWIVQRLQSLNEGHLNYINIKVYGPLMVMQRNTSLCKYTYCFQHEKKKKQVKYWVINLWKIGSRCTFECSKFRLFWLFRSVIAWVFCETAWVHKLLHTQKQH